MKGRQSMAFSAENPTGTNNSSTRGEDCEKFNACLKSAAGETVTICDTDGRA